MKKIIALMLCLCMILAFGAVASADDFAEPMLYQLGDKVEDFTVELCDGSVVSLYGMLEEYDLVMVNIWATWCGPCRAEFPVMNEAYDMYSDQIGLLCLSPYDSNEDVAEFRDSLGLTLPMGYDSVGAGGFVLEGYPTTILIDRFGTYVLYECGSMLSVSEFTDKWDLYLGDDYTESVVYVEHNTPNLMPLIADEILTDALCTDAGVMVFGSVDDVYVWPFYPAENGVTSTTADTPKSECTLTAVVSAEAGDVFAMDYSVNVQLLYDYLEICVNGETVKMLTDVCEGTFVYAFDKAGDNTFTFTYVRSEYDFDENAENTVNFCNARLVSGDEAVAVLAALPVYPAPLRGSEMRIDVVSEGAKKIVFNDPNGMIEANYGSEVEYYLVPADFGSFRTVIGPDIDPDSLLMYGDYDAQITIASQGEHDEEGFLFQAALSSVEAGGYDNTYVDARALDGTASTRIIVFRNEENIGDFLTCSVYDENGNPVEGITWEYEDGSQPSTDATAETLNTPAYEIVLIDEKGMPVDGVMINICTDATCTPTMTEGGYYGFDGNEEYVIHVLMVPAGYAFDTSREFTMVAGGERLEIVIPHAE